MFEPVVVTGTGIVSALGTSVDAALQRMAAGERGFAVTEAGGRSVPHAPVTGFDPGQYVPRKKLRRMDPANTYAIAAARMALEQAGLAGDDALKRNLGVIVGTGYSGFASVVEHQRAYLRDGIAQLTPIHFPNTVYNASAGMVAIELGLDGPNSTVTGHDVSGEYAIAYAWMLLQQGMAERVVVVGVDELCPALLEGLHDLGFAARDAAAPAQPLGRAPQGFVPGEGAGALLLETGAAAAARGAAVLGRIEGLGVHGGAESVYAYGRDGAAVLQSAGAALAHAGIGLDALDWVSSAANGSAGPDQAEAQAWSAMLDPRRHAIVPFKRHTGEFDASGVMRVVLGLGCLARGGLPDSLGDDPAESLRPFRAAAARPAGTRFLHHGLGLGGNSVSIVVGGGGHAH